MAHKVGDNFDNEIHGTERNDLLEGLGGADRLFGEEGNDKLLGGNGDDMLWGGAGNDTLIGGDGFDVLGLLGGAEVAIGGGGTDYLDFYYATEGINVDLSKGSAKYVIEGGAGSVTFSGVEGLLGSQHDDVVRGGETDDIIQTQDGNDTVHGEGGQDWVIGGKGNDLVFGDGGDDEYWVSAGNDTFYGGQGSDILAFSDSSKGINLTMKSGQVSYATDLGRGMTTFSSVEEVWGSSRGDIIAGTDQGETLRGKEGRDTLRGNDGRDIIIGGASADTLSGGLANDMFIFEQNAASRFADTITDFKAGRDLLAFDGTWFDLSTVDHKQTFNDLECYLLDPEQFQSGDGHKPASDQIRMVYDRTDGNLYYKSFEGMSVIAHLGEGLNLHSNSIALLYDLN